MQLLFRLRLQGLSIGEIDVCYGGVIQLLDENAIKKAQSLLCFAYTAGTPIRQLCMQNRADSVLNYWHFRLREPGNAAVADIDLSNFLSLQSESE